MEQLLSVDSLEVSYGKALAVQQCSLAVGRGQVVAIVGPNGAGKSSLLNALAGLHRFSGSAVYAGHDLSRMTAEERVGKGLCLVPETRELFASLNVESNLRLGAYTRRLSKAAMVDELGAIYQMFPRLMERRHQLAGSLSGGEQQMLALARALMMKPTLLMLDEPSLGLAPLIIKEIFETICGLRSRGNSILLVEQNARAALDISDIAYVMDAGRITAHGLAKEMMDKEDVAAAYLGRH